MILFATILSSIFPTSFKWQIDLNDDGESTSFFSGLSIRTRLTIFANEPVRRHVFKKVVSISLSSRRIVSSTRLRYLPGVGQYFSPHIFNCQGELSVRYWWKEQFNCVRAGLGSFLLRVWEEYL